MFHQHYQPGPPSTSDRLKSILESDRSDWPERLHFSARSRYEQALAFDDNILAAIGRAAEALRSGGIALFPTETVYGLGARFDHTEALLRVFAVKQRPHFNPLIVHLATEDWLGQITDGSLISPTERLLMQRFWPGPLTFVLPKLPGVPDLVTAGLDTVAVRMPAHPIALAMIRLAGMPIAAPSANFFGALSPTRFDDLHDRIRCQVDAAIDGGPCQVGLESTVIQVKPDRIAMLRHGGITQEDLAAASGLPVEYCPEQIGSTPRNSPGRLPSHYAPRAKLVIFSGTPPIDPAAGFLFFKGIPGSILEARSEVLSSQGDLREAAARFFSALKRLDNLGLPTIYAERVPAHGLGNAINDRLARAATSMPDATIAGQPTRELLNCGILR